MKRKTIIAAVMLLVSRASVFGGETALKLTMTNGDVSWYVLSERPRISFQSDKMHIATENFSADVARTDVAAITFADYTPTSLAEINGADSFIKFTGNCVEANGATVDIYTADGRLVASGHEAVSTSGLSAGIYIARAGKQTLKIAVR